MNNKRYTIPKNKKGIFMLKTFKGKLFDIGYVAKPTGIRRLLVLPKLNLSMFLPYSVGDEAQICLILTPPSSKKGDYINIKVFPKIIRSVIKQGDNLALEGTQEESNYLEELKPIQDFKKSGRNIIAVKLTKQEYHEVYIEWVDSKDINTTGGWERIACFTVGDSEAYHRDILIVLFNFVCTILASIILYHLLH